MERLEKFNKIENALNLCLQKKCVEYYKLKMDTKALAQKEMKPHSEKLNEIITKLMNTQVETIKSNNPKLRKDITKYSNQMNTIMIKMFKISLKYLKKMISTNKFLHAVQCGNRKCRADLLLYIKNIEKILKSRGLTNDLKEKKLIDDYIKTYEKMINIMKKELNIK